MGDADNFVPGTAENKKQINAQDLEGFQKYILQKFVDTRGNDFEDNQGQVIGMEENKLGFVQPLVAD